MKKSKIEWTESTWNPVTGCTKVSDGCKNCYAERMALRLQAMGQPNYKNGFRSTEHRHILNAPLKWKKPRMIFVNSMSDLFHKDVSDSFILEMFSVMRTAWWHTFQILTKRSERLLQMDLSIDWLSNVWMGVTVENEKYKHRIEDLRNTNAKVKFLSLEPLLGPIQNLDLRGIHWVIVGGESGPNARPMEKRWVIDIKDQCDIQDVPFFFKQWGGINKKRTGRLLEGRVWNDLPNTTKDLLVGI
jgi:protein gp37